MKDKYLDKNGHVKYGEEMAGDILYGATFTTDAEALKKKNLEKLNNIIKKAKLVIISKTIYSKVGEEDQELRHWDVFRALIEKIEQEYVENKNYKGIPMSSKNYFLLKEIYNDASERERKMIFNFLLVTWDSLFRHWKICMDGQYGKGKWGNIF